jgi:hypothetical protein
MTPSGWMMAARRGIVRAQNETMSTMCMVLRRSLCG